MLLRLVTAVSLLQTPYFFFGLLGVAIAVLLMVSVRDPTVAQQKIEDEKLQRLLSPNVGSCIGCRLSLALPLQMPWAAYITLRGS